ncbi:MAG: hypothetical protein M3065_03690 [Actinomycetota bacterium]|nr:hypothetical protein [Actinomycetota bacterium]
MATGARVLNQLNLVVEDMDCHVQLGSKARSDDQQGLVPGMDVSAAL